MRAVALLRDTVMLWDSCSYWDNDIKQQRFNVERV